MRCWMLRERWIGRREGGGWNELLDAVGGWVGGWVGRREEEEETHLFEYCVSINRICNAAPKALTCASEIPGKEDEEEEEEEEEDIVRSPVFSAYRRATAASVSSTMPIAPAPSTNPLRRLSNGRAASATEEEMEAAPKARNPLPNQGIRTSPEALSDAMMTRRSHRPCWMMSVVGWVGGWVGE